MLVIAGLITDLLNNYAGDEAWRKLNRFRSQPSLLPELVGRVDQKGGKCRKKFAQHRFMIVKFRHHI